MLSDSCLSVMGKDVRVRLCLSCLNSAITTIDIVQKPGADALRMRSAIHMLKSSVLQSLWYGATCSTAYALDLGVFSNENSDVVDLLGHFFDL